MEPSRVVSSEKESSQRLLAPFMTEDFDVASFVRETIAATEKHAKQGGGGGGSKEAVLKQIEGCIQKADDELRERIVGCHDQVLANVRDIDELEAELLDLSSTNAELKEVIGRLTGPDYLGIFVKLKQRIELLSRCHSVNHLARRLIRFQGEVKKLRVLTESGSLKDSRRLSYVSDISKAAAALREVDLILEEDAEKGHQLKLVLAAKDDLSWLSSAAVRDLRTKIQTVDVGAGA